VVPLRIVACHIDGTTTTELVSSSGGNARLSLNVTVQVIVPTTTTKPKVIAKLQALVAHFTCHCPRCELERG
jgi:hypothetical protein